MTFTLLALMVAAPLPVKDESPKGPPPQVMVVSVQPDGTPAITQGQIRMVADERTVTAIDGMKPVTRKVTVMVPVSVTTLVAVDGKDVQVFGIDGKKIDPKAVRNLIGRSMAVLVSADGKPVDPFYLRLAKEGTLVVVMPTPPEGVRAIPPPPEPMKFPVPPQER